MSVAAAVLIFAGILAIVLTCHQSSADCESTKITSQNEYAGCSQSITLRYFASRMKEFTRH